MTSNLIPPPGASWDEAYDCGAKAMMAMWGSSQDSQNKAILEAMKHPEYDAWIMGWTEKGDELGRAEMAQGKQAR